MTQIVSTSQSGRELPLIQTAVPGPKSLELAERLKRVESPDTTFFSPEFPIFWESALGSTITDVDGNRYVDFNAGFGVASVGHRHPEVVRAIQEQSKHLIHGMGDVHPTEIKVQLAEEIVRDAPEGHRWKVIFGTSGADAVEAALKTAAIATGRPGVIAFEGGYHGLTMGTLRVTSGEKFRSGLEELISETVVRFPYPAADGESGNGAYTREIIGAIGKLLQSPTGPGKRIGAMLIEPILGRGGIVVPPVGFLGTLRWLCNEHNLLLIFDEVYTGFGRTGNRFACNHEGDVPDLIAAGKSLGGGMPISVCIGKAEIIDSWGVSSGEARHTSTFLGHPLACASALATLRVIKKELLLEAAQTKGRMLKEMLVSMLAGNACVSSIRGRGMMIGIEIVDPSTREPDSLRAWSVVVDSLKRGVILIPAGPKGNVLSITPPLTISTEQMEFGANVIAEALDGVRMGKQTS